MKEASRKINCTRTCMHIGMKCTIFLCLHHRAASRFSFLFSKLSLIISLTSGLEVTSLTPNINKLQSVHFIVLFLQTVLVYIYVKVVI